MCEPVSIITGIGLATSIASAATSIVGQQQNQKTQMAYQQRLVDANRRQMQENRTLATRAYLDQAVAANQNLSQTREATAGKNFDEQVKAEQARGKVVAASSESGLTGLSLQSLLDDFKRHEDMFLTRNDQNLLFKEQQTATEIEGFRNTADSRIAQIKPYIPAPVAPVDYFGPILGIAQSGVNSYLGYKAATKPASSTVNNYYNY